MKQQGPVEVPARGRGRRARGRCRRTASRSRWRSPSRRSASRPGDGRAVRFAFLWARLPAAVEPDLAGGASRSTRPSASRRPTSPRARAGRASWVGRTWAVPAPSPRATGERSSSTTGAHAARTRRPRVRLPASTKSARRARSIASRCPCSRTTSGGSPSASRCRRTTSSLLARGYRFLNRKAEALAVLGGLDADPAWRGTDRLLYERALTLESAERYARGRRGVDDPREPRTAGRPAALPGDGRTRARRTRRISRRISRPGASSRRRTSPPLVLLRTTRGNVVIQLHDDVPNATRELHDARRRAGRRTAAASTTGRSSTA